MPNTLTRISGVVASVNDKGLKLEGEDGWRNFSKYAGNLPAFQRGQAVTLLLDGDFVMGVEGGAGGGAPAAPPGTARAQYAPPTAPPSAAGALAARSAALDAAIKLAGVLGQYEGQPLPTSDGVLLVAAKFERWLVRREGAAERE